MKLYLVRHAEALAGAEDSTRPLSEKGLEDARSVSVFLKGAGVRVDSIIHSGRRRAEQTADIYGRAVWPGETPAAMTGIGPDDTITYLCNIIQAAGGDLMVVGHMPFMGRIAAKCLSGSEAGTLVGFEPGAVMCLDRQGEGALHPWELAWFVRPSALGNV